MEKGNQQNQAGNVMTDIAIKGLMRDYLDICNRAIDENAGNFWYDKALKVNDAIWDNPWFRVSVYDQDPDKILDEFVVHFNTDNNRLSLSETTHEVDYSWKFSLNYLEDVKTRADWYIQNPLMLDWKWFTERVSTGAKSFIQKNNQYISIGLGFITGALLTAFLVRRSPGQE
jgi:hypothetical protein